jgi:hypothetical protein
MVVGLPYSFVTALVTLKIFVILKGLATSNLPIRKPQRWGYVVQLQRLTSHNSVDFNGKCAIVAVAAKAAGVNFRVH